MVIDGTCGEGLGAGDVVVHLGGHQSARDNVDSVVMVDGWEGDEGSLLTSILSLFVERKSSVVELIPEAVGEQLAEGVLPEELLLTSHCGSQHQYQHSHTTHPAC